MNPHAVPEQVAVAFAGGVHGVQLAPQDSGESFERQAAPHGCNPVLHVHEQALDMQCAEPPEGALQIVPHVPQLLTSLVRFAHAPEGHSVCPAAQPLSQRCVPFDALSTQTGVPPEHAVPQSPQWVAEVSCVSQPFAAM